VRHVMHRDQLSSTVMITDANADWGIERVYAPFGVDKEWNNASAVDPLPEDIGFIGERKDAVSGLHYLNARYYDPGLRMFIQPDWFEVTEPEVGTNRYAYSGNDPVNLRDPGGNQSRNPGRPAGVGPSLVGSAKTIAEAIAIGSKAASLGILGGDGKVGPPGSVYGPGHLANEPTDEDPPQATPGKGHNQPPDDEPPDPKGLPPGFYVSEDGDLIEIDENGNIVTPPEEVATNVETPADTEVHIQDGNLHGKDPLGQGSRKGGWRGFLEAIGDLLGSDIGPSS